MTREGGAVPPESRSFGWLVLILHQLSGAYASRHGAHRLHLHPQPPALPARLPRRPGAPDRQPGRLRRTGGGQLLDRRHPGGTGTARGPDPEREPDPGQPAWRIPGAQCRRLGMPHALHRLYRRRRDPGGGLGGAHPERARRGPVAPRGARRPGTAHVGSAASSLVAIPAARRAVDHRGRGPGRVPATPACPPTSPPIPSTWC